MNIKVAYKHFRYSTGSLKRDKKDILESGNLIAASSVAQKGVLAPYNKDTWWEPETRGGETVCYLFVGSKLLAMGRARCSLDDQFVYEVGQRLALADAFENAAKKERSLVRKKYPKTFEHKAKIPEYSISAGTGNVTVAGIFGT